MTAKRTHHGWMLLFKFGERQFLEELRERGVLYMQASTRFAELEKKAHASVSRVDPVRADRFEGSEFAYHPKQHNILIEAPGPLDNQGKVQNFRIRIPSEGIAAHTLIHLNERSCNIFCMYATTTPEPVDVRNFAFGDSFVIIKNT
jgi:hypothetical protein